MAKRTISRRNALKTIGVTGAVGVAGCMGSGGGGGDSDTVQAAWVYISEVGDLGWSWAHDQGRQAVDDKFDWLETAYSEAVPPSEGQQVIEQYTQEGYDIIFGTTFEYMDPMLQIAQQNSDTLYEHCSGYKTAENMGRYFGRMYQARYLAGVAAGHVTESDTLGYVAAFPIPEVIRGINAFTLGAKSVNDQVSTKVRWTNTWFDPPTEREAAQSLIDEGADVMAQHQDSPAAVEAANDAGIWSTGYDAPMGEFGGDKYLTSPVWHWEVFYEPTLQSVHDDSWESDFYWEGLESGVVALDDWGPSVPEEAQNTVSQERSAITEGDRNVWANSKFADADDSALFQDMSSYVDGVEGEVPD